MKKKSRWINVLVVVLLLIISVECVAYADDEVINSQGRIVFDNNTEDTTDDVVFDASDLVTLDTMVKTGKTNIATVLNEYPNTEVQTLDTFDNLATAIDKLTNVPDVYYYDKATEGDSCVRYILVDGNYYPCDQYGVQTSDTALSGTITVVTKDDTTEPADGEIQLVKYEQTDAANLSAGFAGYADKAFILGSGSDNISYRNQSRPTTVLVGTYNIDGSQSTSKTTVNLSSYEGYENFVLYENIFPVLTKSGISIDDSKSAGEASAQATYSYNATTGKLTLKLGYASSKWYALASVKVYLVY